ncbi:C39 family peptidase [Candidatus Woesebacteria bacterium]|nr:C39 family peptidase [Candidatus Woesebacteria bacterium]
MKNSPIVKAETILFQDDFSNGFEKWDSVRNTFDMWSIVDNQANVLVNKSSTLAELVPKDIYWNPNWKNIIYELDYKYIQGADKNISFGFKDVLNWYEIHFVGNSFFLSHVKNGKVVWDFSDIAHLGINVFHHVKIQLNEGQIIIKIDENEIVNIVDPTFDNDYGKIGIKAGAGTIFPTQAIYDNIIVKMLSSQSNILNIIPQKQNDPIWANEEYDSASNWADETNIDRWGCLVTSISMIMNFHGINKMPDNNLVNPSTINTWLKSQPDGYLANGLVNWMAISRLTKEINNNYQTPNLEYKRVSGPELTTAKAEILNNKPVVLQIDGHFLVGDGVVEPSTNQVTAPGNEIITEDLYITDPAYNYQKFSEHQKDLISTRTLTPSFTDLSYIHISTDENTTIEIKKADGTQINNLQIFTEHLSDFVSNENLPAGGESQNNSQSMKIIEIEKPENGEYLLDISRISLGESKVNIFAYDMNGNLSNLSYSGVVGTNKLRFILHYQNQGVSTINKNLGFETLLNDLNELYASKNIKKHYVFVELKKYTQFAINSLPENKPRYNNLIRNLIEWYSPQITQNEKILLELRLSEIAGIIQE